MICKFRAVFDDGCQFDFGVINFNADKILKRFKAKLKRHIKENGYDKDLFWGRLYRQYHDRSFGPAIAAANGTDCGWCNLY